MPKPLAGQEEGLTYQVEAHLFVACALEGRSLLSTLEAGINGVLVIDHGHFSGRYEFLSDKRQSQGFEYDAQDTSIALWGLITCIHHAGSMVTSTIKNVPKAYGQ